MDTRNMSAEEYYRILGLTPNATLADVKKAYRRLARQYHPDRNNTDDDCSEKFRRITEAYRYLSHHLDSGNGHQRGKPQTPAPTQSPEDIQTLIAYCEKEEALVTERLNVLIRYPYYQTQANELLTEIADWVRTRRVLPDVASHYWYSADKDQIAHSILGKALTAIRKNRPTIVRFALNSLINEYDSDRALHASNLLKTDQPIQHAGLPDHPPGIVPYIVTATGLTVPTVVVGTRHIEPLTDWETGQPASVISDIGILIDEEIPDRLFRVTWQFQPGTVLYAQYGNWCVKLAEWK